MRVEDEIRPPTLVVFLEIGQHLLVGREAPGQPHQHFQKGLVLQRQKHEQAGHFRPVKDAQDLAVLPGRGIQQVPPHLFFADEHRVAEIGVAVDLVCKVQVFLYTCQHFYHRSIPPYLPFPGIICTFRWL